MKKGRRRFSFSCVAAVIWVASTHLAVRGAASALETPHLSVLPPNAQFFSEPPEASFELRKASSSAATEETSAAPRSSFGASASGVEVEQPTRGLLLVPGIAGSGLLCTLDNASLPACSATPVSVATPFRIWASLSQMRPPESHQRCWVETLSPEVRGEGREYVSRSGVSIVVSSIGALQPAALASSFGEGPFCRNGVVGLAEQEDGFGSTHGMDYLDYYYGERFGVPGTAYFHGVVVTARSLGFSEENFTLWGAPYDWRLGPWQVDFGKLKNLIQEAVAKKGAPLAVVAHSLGCVLMNLFFHKFVDAAWKAEFIHSYTLVAPALGGSFKAIKSLLSGRVSRQTAEEGNGRRGLTLTSELSSSLSFAFVSAATTTLWTTTFGTSST